MIKGLEALEITKDQLDGLLPKGLTPCMKWNIDTIKKELKALEIIKNRCVNTYDEIFCCDSYKEYQDLYHYAEEKFNLEKEEWEFLKEVLKYED